MALPIQIVVNWDRVILYQQVETIILSSGYTASVLVKEIPINSNFGFALIGIIVNSTEYAAADDPTPPYPFTLKLELSEVAPAE